jgi:hypothetical protein
LEDEPLNKEACSCSGKLHLVTISGEQAPAIMENLMMSEAPFDFRADSGTASQ